MLLWVLLKEHIPLRPSELKLSKFPWELGLGFSFLAKGTDETAGAAARGHLPTWQTVQGLPQAAPRDEQHWDFKVAPLMLISHRPSMAICQQVPLMVSAVGRSS